MDKLQLLQPNCFSDTKNTFKHYDGTYDINYLSNVNKHERDDYIEFDEGPHIYTISLPGTEPTTGYTSVTTWVHNNFEKFDADLIIERMMNSPKWPRNKYYGKTPDEIKAMWDKNRDEAAQAGTNMHFDIECFYNNAPMEDLTRLQNEEFSYFINFQKDLERGLFGKLVPFRTEWTVFHEDTELSGSIDMVYIKPDTNTLAIYDWKRCRNIEKGNPFNKWSNNPVLSQIPDTNYWHYSLQLNTYRFILQDKYGFIVDELYLVSLHPNKNQYIRLKVPIMDELIKEALGKHY